MAKKRLAGWGGTGHDSIHVFEKEMMNSVFGL
uniref:Uncharacterized protein n=1 Tax=Nelumbo nucifera TaxID=4432 RepID=A0A822XFW4_NELNU|nr:TPA_asm: hypothetical protein HUJ06_020570 [Nelumbo nucifera]